MSGAVAVKDGLNIERRSDESRHPADPACPFQEVEVLNGKVLAAVYDLLVNDGSRFPRTQALAAEFCRFYGQKAAPEAAAHRVHYVYKAIAELFHELLRSDPGRIEGSADARTHHDTDHIGTLCEDRLKISDKEFGVEKTCMHLFPVLKAFVICMTVKVIDVSPVLLWFSVYRIVIGQQLNTAKHLLRQICTSVSKHRKSHMCLPPCSLYTGQTVMIQLLKKRRELNS